MATFQIGEKVYKSGPVPLRLGCEAEKMLQVHMADGGFALTAIQLYVAIRQTDPDTPPVVVADTVMNADFLRLYGEEEGKDDSAPLGENGGNPAAQTEATDLATIGPPDSVR